jgi:alkanesulfonate monooxygenase SsuD/methylene tetrahydromethanopterin reductase-like flavin-dependent oxidoreductase (luciferase family)
MLARRLSTLDLLSNGRLRVGMGWSKIGAHEIILDPTFSSGAQRLDCWLERMEQLQNIARQCCRHFHWMTPGADGQRRDLRPSE